MQLIVKQNNELGADHKLKNGDVIKIVSTLSRGIELLGLRN